MSSTLPPLSLDSTPLHHPALYAEVVDQLGQTVQQLLLAALARARQLPTPQLPQVPHVPPCRRPGLPSGPPRAASAPANARCCNASPLATATR